ncbi:ThiJ/PfpI family protein [Poronia punctata]|nr:ThiJ/PfpI family protein [Poronia punctata]
MSPEIKIGVLLANTPQLLDLACIDIFHMMSREYLSLLDFLPKYIAASAPSVQIYYIVSPSSSSDGNDIKAPLTANATLSIPPTHTTSSFPPGSLDILLIPGPDPSSSFDRETLSFLKSHGENGKTDILSVCTGIFICGEAGLLERKEGKGKGKERVKACGPRGMQDVLEKKFPEAEFVGGRVRWWRDGRFWSCGGVTNGNDLVAAYARANSDRFPPAVVEMACKMADVGDRPQVYGESQTGFKAGFVWTLVKGWFGYMLK